MKNVLLVVLSVEETEFREVKHLATVDEFHVLFSYICFIYVCMYVCVLCVLFRNNLKCFYKSGYNIVRQNNS